MVIFRHTQYIVNVYLLFLEVAQATSKSISLKLHKFRYYLLSMTSWALWFWWSCFALHYSSSLLIFFASQGDPLPSPGKELILGLLCYMHSPVRAEAHPEPLAGVTQLANKCPASPVLPAEKVSLAFSDRQTPHCPADKPVTPCLQVQSGHAD